MNAFIIVLKNSIETFETYRLLSTAGISSTLRKFELPENHYFVNGFSFLNSKKKPIKPQAKQVLKTKFNIIKYLKTTNYFLYNSTKN